MNDVFTLEHDDNEKVVLKVNANNPLVIAMHPYVNANMAYITVTKGDNHILTVILKDGKTWSFEWGYNGHTLICDALKELQKAVVNFITWNCHIMLDYCGEPIEEISIYYNDNFKKWEYIIHFKGASKGRYCGFACVFSDTANSYLDMIRETISFVPYVKEWNKGIAQTGIEIWKAVF